MRPVLDASVQISLHHLTDTRLCQQPSFILATGLTQSMSSYTQLQTKACLHHSTLRCAAHEYWESVAGNAFRSGVVRISFSVKKTQHEISMLVHEVYFLNTG